MSNLWQKHFRTVGKYMLHVPLETFHYSILISLKHKYLYVETPKVACSTVKATLYRLELEDSELEWEDFEDIHKREYSPLLNPKQVGDFDAFIARDDIFKFCLVRNPYNRLLSCFLDKIVGKQYPKRIILQQLGHDSSDLTIDVSFREFVLSVSQQPVSMMDLHWRPQHYQTYQAGISYDLVGRLENFDEDFRRIGQRLSENFSKYFHHEVRHRTGSGMHLRQFYTPELQQLVYDIYRVDFEHFGYLRELPMMQD